MALSRFGLTPRQFQDISPLEFYEAIKDDNELRKYPLRTIADSIRMQTLWLVNIQLPRGKKVRNERRLWTLPWDKPQGQKELQTVDQMRQVLKRIAADTKGNKKRGTRGLPGPSYSAHRRKHKR